MKIEQQRDKSVAQHNTVLAALAEDFALMAEKARNPLQLINCYGYVYSSATWQLVAVLRLDLSYALAKHRVIAREDEESMSGVC